MGYQFSAAKPSRGIDKDTIDKSPRETFTHILALALNLQIHPLAINPND